MNTKVRDLETSRAALRQALCQFKNEGGHVYSTQFRDADELIEAIETHIRWLGIDRLEALVKVLRDEIKGWREQAAAEEHCQRTGGNPQGATAYRACADSLEGTLDEVEKMR